MAKRKGSMLADIAGEDCKLEMTPMIDVTFLLLIFFMCTLKFKTLEGKLSAFLPKDVGVNQSEAEPKEKIEIRMDVKNPGNRVRPGAGNVAYTAQDEAERKRYVYDSSRVITFSVGAKKTTDLEEVRKTLTNFYAQDKTRPATIDPRAGIITSDVVELLDVALDVGFTDITFVGSYEK
ncbi:MAG: biopolymer transporter ExbD [Planctomycetota bacterium]